MVLRKLSIFGFKSFADKTELKFGDGMTAVIGPNGCGKSNVVDAIRWVFGEQKTTVLRSANMQDVIFSGTEKRHPLNMAEVTLTISNNKGLLPIEYSEVAITRRIYRSGDSEYLINKTQSRLKDIHSMFIDTGVGSSAYTTIENSMINKILSDKAEERRILFEEAAGIGKYKQKIKESQRKLDRTKQDLLRINDRVQEKDRYVRMLGRQVEKAKRYKRYHDDLKSLEVGYENRRFKMLDDALKSRTQEMSELTSLIETFKAKIAGAETKIEKMELQKVEKENDVQIASQHVTNSTDKINALDREISVSNQSLTYLHQNVNRFEQETGSFNDQASEKKHLLNNIEKSIISRETQLEEHTIRVSGAKNELQEFDIRVQGQREQVDELSTGQLNLVHSLGVMQKELSNSQTNLTNCLERCERDESEIRRLEEHLEEYRESLESCKRQLITANESFKNYMQTREKLWNRIEGEDRQYHVFVEKEKHLEAKIDSGKSQLRFLEGLDSSYEGYSHGVKALLEKNLPGTLGIVADLIKVNSPEMVSIVERALGSSIQTVVFKTDANMEAAISFLKTEKAGIARMVSLEGISSIRDNTSTKAIGNSYQLQIYISTKKECESIANYLLNKILVCDTSKTALSLQSQIQTDSCIISKEGTLCYANGTVVAGAKKKEQVGILQRKQEIEKLTRDIVIFQKDYNKIVHDKEICIINRDEAKRALIEVDEKLNTGRQVQQEQETNIKHYENEIENIKERIEILIPGLTENQKQIEYYEEKMKEQQKKLSQFTQERNDLDAQMDSTKSRLHEMEAERSELAEHLKNVELARQGLANRVEQDKNSIEHLKRDVNGLQASKQKKIEDKNSALSEIKELEKKIVILKEELTSQTEKREELERVFESVREEYTGILNSIEEERVEIKVLQKDLEEHSNKKHSLEVDQTRDEEHKRAIREKIFTAYEIDLQSPPEDTPLLDEEDADTIDNINMLKERLRRVGEVNMGAINEFEQENGDLQEMIKQRDDLQTAVDDLEKAIKKLDREARIQFQETFKEVQSNFREMFTTLFEGGEASITLEEDVDPLYAAIKINVRPAGKKMRGVTLLSGGERALTAISLLFALYMVKPSAYCILDELDAPLDDANVDRFIRVLRKFAEKTQFIIITHNKHTMEAADLLYGVTQQEKGISTVASVQLNDILKLRVA